MSEHEKCLADQMYDACENQPPKRENKSAVGGGGGLKPFCVDGAVLYCTAGSESSRLRVKDHGLYLTGVAAAHDGDCAPNENIFPFGACKLKNNNPCQPAPVGRWLLPAEYAVYAGKKALYQQANALRDKAAEAAAPFCTAALALPRTLMPRVEPGLRNEIFRAARSAAREQERIANSLRRVFTDPRELADELDFVQNALRRAAEALGFMNDTFESGLRYRQVVWRQYNEIEKALKPENEDNPQMRSLLELRSKYKCLLDESKDCIDGLSEDARQELAAIFSSLESRAKESARQAGGLIEEAKSASEAVAEDQGRQITVDSIIPCRLGGTIYV